METVVISDIKNHSIQDGLEGIFAAFGGVRAVIQSNLKILIKPNAIHFTPQSYTDPSVLEALLAWLRDHGYRNLEVMENATNGNFTRLVFHAIGYTKICKRYGAKPVFLDENPTVEVFLHGENEPTRIPRHLYLHLFRHREENYYLDLPKLKTHSMSMVTLGIKNQQAFPIHADRMHRHNHATLHQRLASIYHLIRPDFCIIEGINAIQHGHVPIQAFLNEYVVPMGVLIGGRDTLAVDTIGARILGYDVSEIDHLRLCREWGLGESEPNNIPVVGIPLSRFTERLPFTLLGRYHPGVTILEGREMACREGCKGNTLAIQEMLTNDHPGRGGWTLVFGKGIDKSQLAQTHGPILVVGRCATAELSAWLSAQLPGRKAYFVNACNDLMTNTHYQSGLMGVPPIKLSPLNPLISAWLLLTAKLHRSTARVPPVFG